MDDLTFYDANGEPIAYSEDGESIYLFSGEPVAYIEDGSVWNYDGYHLGRFEDGWIRDNDGNAAFFTDLAQGGPLNPLKKPSSVKEPEGTQTNEGSEGNPPPSFPQEPRLVGAFGTGLLLPQAELMNLSKCT